VDGALLVADQDVGQVGSALDAVQGLQFGLEQRLADTGHVAVPEDAEASRDQPLLHPVPF